MMWYAFLAALLIAFVAVRSDHVDHEAVKRLYDAEDRAILKDYRGEPEEKAADEAEQDELWRASLRAPKNDDGPKNCSKECKDYECDIVDVPKGFEDEDDYLHFENQPINCRFGARDFLMTPVKKLLSEDLWDCCRRCNLKFYRCLAKGNELGVKERCLRESYTCMCTCLRKFPLDK